MGKRTCATVGATIILSTAIVLAVQYDSPDSVYSSGGSWGGGSHQATNNGGSIVYIAGWTGGGTGNRGGYGNGWFIKDFTWTGSSGTYHAQYRYYIKGRMIENGDGVAYQETYILLRDTTSPATLWTTTSTFNAGPGTSDYDQPVTVGADVYLVNGHSYRFYTNNKAYATASDGNSTSDFATNGRYVSWVYLKFT